MTRFTQLYERPTALSSDSKRMRIRLDAYLESLIGTEAGELAGFFRSQQGVFVRDRYHPFQDLELRDVLDGITTVAHFLRSSDENIYGSSGRKGKAYTWIALTAIIFREEHLGYRVDDEGIVHFAVDEDFERNRVTTLNDLGATRYAAARQEFEEAFNALRGAPPNGKAAIRGVFTAVETLFKLMFPKAPRLGGAEIRTHLKPVVARTYAGDATAGRSTDKTAESFVNWVDAAHFYRHAQGEEEPTEPPLETTVLLISQGSAFLRWLMTVDAAELARSETASQPVG